MTEKTTSDLKGHIKAIKQLQSTQLTKLQGKYEAESELLDVLRDYMTKRSEIEHQYSKSLEKLAKNVSSRKFRKYLGVSQSPLVFQNESTGSGDITSATTTSATTPTPGPVITNREPYLAILKMLAESDKEAKNRAEVSDKIVGQISETIREFNKEKASTAKKTIEYGNKYHHEMALAYDELEKSKAVYEKAAKDADAAQKKYDDAVKRPKSGLQALKNLVTGKDQEERIQHLKTKCKTKSRKLNDARNEYVVALEGANAIQNLYYKEDLKNLMIKLDGEYYNTMGKVLTSFSDLEASTSQVIKGSVDTVRSHAQRINREKDVSSFLSDFQDIFRDPLPFTFETSGLDETTNLVVDDVTRVILGQRLGQLIVEDDALASSQAQLEKELNGLKQMASVYSQTPQFGNASTPIEQKQDAENALDLIRCQRIRRNAQMKAIRDLGVEPIKPALLEDASSTNILPTIDRSGKVLYDFSATKPNELSVKEGETVQIMDFEQDEWLRVKNVAGVIGLVPVNYVEKPASLVPIASSSATPSPTTGAPSNVVVALYDYEASEEGELSFKAGDKIECLDGIDPEDDWWEGRVVGTGETGTFPVHFTKGWEAIAAAQPKPDLAILARRASRNLKRTNSIASKTSSVIPTSASNSKPFSASPSKARVLYSYDATCDGELSVVAGEIITIVNKDTGSDAWWEGEGSKGRGQFPTNYVELLDDNLTPVNPKRAINAVAEITSVRALYDFSATTAGELSFATGDIIKVTQSSDPDWWDGEINGKVGAFPANYVEIVQ